MTSTSPQGFDLSVSWQQVLHEEWQKPYLRDLAAFIAQEEAAGYPIYPPRPLIFSALNQTPLESVKVVIVGQDPYHGAGQAHGLSFSVPVGVPIPPSLRNIYKELQQDVAIPPPTHGCLLHWAHQGVLLLNATLTVRDAQAKSHYGRGWERFTDAVLTEVLKRDAPVVFLLWGASAMEKLTHLKAFSSPTPRLVLTAAHPSPLSAHRGFLGCRHFSQANSYLIQQGLAPIDWNVA